MAHAKCSNCREDFSGISYFDRHQEVSDDGATVRCLDPASVGLEKVNGRWSDPDASWDSSSPDGPKHLECKNCGTEWKMPRSRGRYPTTCDSISAKVDSVIVDGDTCHES